MERQNEAVLVAIQVNVFTCGGISIGLHFLHRIMDATTLQAFLSCWARNIPGYQCSLVLPSSKRLANTRRSGNIFVQTKVVSEQRRSLEEICI
ncbi:hypothetical protein CsSME_00034308 [Camellia sinensis var. sinensis]